MERKARARWSLATNNDILLKAPQSIDLAVHGGIGQDPRRLLE